jgi:hypothetical protein
LSPRRQNPGVIRQSGRRAPDLVLDRPGRLGVAERFVVPLKLGNSGGGKGPQFKTDAICGEGPGRLGNL